MDAREFTRRLWTDPADPELKAAARESYPGAELELRRVQAFDARLREALAGLPVPDARPLRLPRRRPLAWMGVAASLLIGLGAAWLWRDAAPPVALGTSAEAAASHLQHEPFALTRRELVPPMLVRRMFVEAGAVLAADPGPVHFLARCPVDGVRAVHLVSQRQAGPVTAIWFPAREAPGRADGRTQGMATRLFPYAGGTLVFLAESSRDFDAMEVDWLAAERGQGVAERSR